LLSERCAAGCSDLIIDLNLLKKLVLDLKLWISQRKAKKQCRSIQEPAMTLKIRNLLRRSDGRAKLVLELALVIQMLRQRNNSDL
jgi:hypothetical protein